MKVLKIKLRNPEKSKKKSLLLELKEEGKGRKKIYIK